MAVVTPAERAAAASFTTVPRTSLPQLASPSAAPCSPPAGWRCRWWPAVCSRLRTTLHFGAFRKYELLVRALARKRMARLSVRFSVS
jgi:hypothetical protein